MLAATGRAAHLLTYGQRPLVIDWLAYPLRGQDADTLFDAARGLVGDTAAEYAARIRLTEDWLAVSQVEQYVIVAAGLDSVAWRHVGAIPDVRVRRGGRARTAHDSRRVGVQTRTFAKRKVS